VIQDLLENGHPGISIHV